MLVHGTYFLFNVAIAILKLTEKDLLSLDMGGINDYFKSFKGEEGTLNALLPSYETIIAESLKVRIAEDRLNQLKI